MKFCIGWMFLVFLVWGGGGLLEKPDFLLKVTAFCFAESTSHLLGPGQTLNFTCAECNANEYKFYYSTSFALDTAHVKFDV